VKLLIYSFNCILGEYGPFDVMKMDCEGCEYDAIASSKRVGEIKQIQIEYHYGPERLLEALKNAGFEVKATKPMKYYDPHALNPDKSLGYVYAWKGLVSQASP